MNDSGGADARQASLSTRRAAAAGLDSTTNTARPNTGESEISNEHAVLSDDDDEDGELQWDDESNTVDSPAEQNVLGRHGMWRPRRRRRKCELTHHAVSLGTVSRF